MLFIMVSKKNPLYDSISTILSPVVANFIAKKKIQDKNHIYLKEYCRFYNIFYFMVWWLFQDGAHLYFGDKQTKKFKLV